MLSRLKLFAVLALAITICVTQENQKNLSETTSDLEIQEIHGLVDDCCCNAESIDKFNNDNIHYILEQLTTVISFFKYFKVDIYRDCPFWAEQQLCSIKAGGGCGACICDEKEVPFHILEKDRIEKLDVVKEEVQFKDVKKWRDREKDIWIKMDNQRDMVYLDLTKNPERFTGYDGYNATRIWRAIYMENCFHPKNDEGLCFEERVFYRLISGLHGSTSAHIAELYYMDGKWQPNMEFYAKNLGIWPDRIKNIYFTYLFLLRAVKKAQHQILEYDFKTGNVTEDTYAELLLKNLIAEPLLCNPTFDETRMFSNPESYKLRDEFKEKFRNISELMDCVTCETCKIHAKLQILGIATALKILTCKDMKYLSLERNEIIALINTLFKFSESITIHHVMKIRLHTQNMEREHQRQHESMANPGSKVIPTQGKETILFLSGILISLFIIIYSFFIIKSNPKTKVPLKKTNKTKPKKN